MMTINTRGFWERYQPIIEEGRVKYGSRRRLSESEFLYCELKYIGEYPELAS